MILVIGTGGLTKQLLPLIEEKIKYGEDIVFFDNVTEKLEEFHRCEVIRDFSSLPENFEFVIGIGDPKWRSHFYDLLIEKGGFPINLISKKSSFPSSKNIGWGNIILDYSIIEPYSIIGEGNLINTHVGIHHDVRIGEFNEVSPGSKILGSASIGDRCRVGTNAVILPKIKICSDVIIGAGAVVTKNIDEPGTYIGIPARKR
jgi:sugar O-acyltransferase (sialic acid O-acetyltransferase NeuD family)